VVTVVRYHAWNGPVYFNMIRPFHHLVVGRMAAAGVRRDGGGKDDDARREIDRDSGR